MSNLSPIIDLNNDSQYSSDSGLSLEGTDELTLTQMSEELPELNLPLDSNDPFFNAPECLYFSEKQMVTNSHLQPNDLFFAHLNVRSLNKNFDQFRDFIKELKFNSLVIGVSETWLKDSPSPLFQIE